VSNPTRFLDPTTLSRISSLELLARTVVDGFISGLHRSPYLGFSVDFAEHRAYMPGDDVRRIDWRVFGRTDRLYVKEFDADTNANFSILFDVSGSMHYGSGPITKVEYGKYLAACLTYLSRRQRDRVGIVTFDDAIIEYVPTSAKHLNVVLYTIDRIQPREREGGFEGPLRTITEMLPRRNVLVVISDLYEDPDTVMRALTLLKYKGNDVIVFHILDPSEVEFPFEEAAQFQDIESGERMPVVPETLREEYRGHIDQHRTTLRRRMARNEIDYCFIQTSQPLDHALFDYLARREQRSRVR